jgi:hypothetical protein
VTLAIALFKVVLNEPKMANEPRGNSLFPGRERGENTWKLEMQSGKKIDALTALGELLLLEEGVAWRGT